MDEIYTGFESLNSIITIKKGELVVIESCPAIGKTSLICSMINNSINKQKILFFSMQLNNHLAVMNLEKKIKKHLNFNLIKDVVDVDEITLSVAEFKLKNGLDVVFIDNFKNITAISEFSTNDIIFKIKELAKRLNVSIIITEEMKRGGNNGYCIYDIMHKEFIKHADKILTLYRLDIDFSREELELNCMGENDAIICVEKGDIAFCSQASLCFDRDTLSFY